MYAKRDTLFAYNPIVEGESLAGKQKASPFNGLARSFVAGSTRLELATSDVTGRRSNQLS